MTQAPNCPNALMKVLDMLVFVGDRHTLKILVVSHSLEISADQEELDPVGVLLLKLLETRVDGV